MLFVLLWSLASYNSWDLKSRTRLSAFFRLVAKMTDWPLVFILSLPLLETGLSPHWISAESTPMWASQGARRQIPPANGGDMGSIPGSRSTWWRAWQPAPVFLPGPHGQKGLAGYSLWDCKSRTQLGNWAPSPLCLCAWRPLPASLAARRQCQISQVTNSKIKSSSPWLFILAPLLTTLLFGGKCQQLEQSLWTVEDKKNQPAS